ncbi:hypothetical protein PLICRDRAFT_48010 [Plicaturopsis crispa FD-325 SS-3]|nr:hypothetical protein PLICRDRAFT_48010 [Plicaturopsis crispa FD-325 SS-3]
MDLEPLDPAYVQEILSKPPFVSLSGVPNIRDLSYYSDAIAPKRFYRAAEISKITPEGKAQMRDLNIAKVFDLRSDTEIAKYDTPIPSIDGVDIERAPVFKTEDYSPEMMAKRYQLYASGKTEAFMELYSQILDHGGPAFGAILRHVRDKPNEGRLFHCTAGKDRTGVIAALILKLADVPDSVIAEDYALTRVGREPSRAMVMERLAREPIFASNNEAALNMFSCRPETMIAFLRLLEEKYGGVDGYLKKYVGFGDEDIAIIRRNILVDATAPS